MNYDHGKRTSQLTHEQSPLDVAIENYKNKARTHFDKLSKEIHEDDDKSIANINGKRRDAFNHLKTERLHVATVATVQKRLDEYRKAYRLAVTGEGEIRDNAVSAMRNERHHPTETLIKYLRADGRPRPSAEHSAHHIVSGKGKTKQMTMARLHIHTMGGVGINDPDNGAWMPKSSRFIPHWATPSAPPHSRIHTHRYEQWVNQSITTQLDELAIRTRLQVLGRMLEAGTQPKNIMVPAPEGQSK